MTEGNISHKIINFFATFRELYFQYSKVNMPNVSSRAKVENVGPKNPGLVASFYRNNQTVEKYFITFFLFD